MCLAVLVLGLTHCAFCWLCIAETASTTTSSSPSTSTSAASLAAEKNYCDVLKILIENRADVNISLKSGATPLYQAVEKERMSTVDMLLTAKANVNLKRSTDHWTPIFVSVKRDNMAILKRLISAKADFHHRSKQGTSLLALAAKKGFKEMEAFLRTLPPALTP